MFELLCVYWFVKKSLKGDDCSIIDTCRGVIGIEIQGVVKAVTLQARSGPESSRKLRFPDFLTKAQEGGKVVSLTHRPHLPAGSTPGTHLY
jgi:hypothetical protein